MGVQMLELLIAGSFIGSINIMTNSFQIKLQQLSIVLRQAVTWENGSLPMLILEKNTCFGFEQLIF